jgi:hypothetical protein
MHEAAVADGSEQEWESEIEAENAGAQVAIGDGDRMAGTEGDVLIDAAIFAEGDLAFGAAIKVVEDGPRYAALGEGAEIRDADYAGRGDGAGGLCHSGDGGSSLKQIDGITDEKLVRNRGSGSV